MYVFWSKLGEKRPFFDILHKEEGFFDQKKKVWKSPKKSIFFPRG